MMHTTSSSRIERNIKYYKRSITQVAVTRSTYCYIVASVAAAGAANIWLTWIWCTTVFFAFLFFCFEKKILKTIKFNQTVNRMRHCIHLCVFEWKRRDEKSTRYNMPWKRMDWWWIEWIENEFCSELVIDWKSVLFAFFANKLD